MQLLLILLHLTRVAILSCEMVSFRFANAEIPFINAIQPI